MKRWVLLCMTVSCLAACTMPFEEPIHTRLSVPYASNNDDQYLESKNGKEVIVKPPLTRYNMSEFYLLPDVSKGSAVSVKPPIR